jgi:hypothetical protein
MLNRTLLALCLLAACGGKHPAPATASAGGGCPPAVPAAVTKAYPDAKQSACEGEHEDGMEIFEVKITKADGSTAELELSANGTILATEEVVAAMPDPVAKAFAAKYPGAEPRKIERITSPGKPVVFEIAFAGKEATFSETGDFVEEEHGEEDADRD